jgi:hypothetical protein
LFRRTYLFSQSVDTSSRWGDDFVVHHCTR